MTRRAPRRDHGAPTPNPATADYQLGSRERIAVRDLEPDEVRRARLTVARYAVDGRVPRVEVRVAEGAVSGQRVTS